MAKFVTGKEAVTHLRSGDHICIIGCLNLLEPETVLHEMEQSFLATQHPRDLTVMFPVVIGRFAGKGLDHFGYEGMVKRVIGGSFSSMLPHRKLIELILQNKVEAYNIPMGSFFTLLRNTGAGQPGLLTGVGLHTFADPRLDGGRLNAVTTEQIVEVKELDGEEWLYYKRFKIDAAIIRGTSADDKGNISLEGEPSSQGILAMAMAAKNNGGIVIAQVRRKVERGTVHPKQVMVPGSLVDFVVLDERDEHADQLYPPSVTGERREEIPSEPAPPGERKVILRRAALELRKNYVVNLGFGIPAGLPAIAVEESVFDDVSFTVEHGPIGGVPGGMGIFGVSHNPDIILDNTSIFDLYAGGLLDMTCLGMGEVDSQGNVNNHKFKHIIAGSGGFNDIIHVTPNIVFVGTFTAGGLKTEVADGKLTILQEGKFSKFAPSVEGITFSAKQARQKRQRVLYITERAVFELAETGIRLTEIAPGIDLQRHIVELLDFKLDISEHLKLMDPRIFQPERMGIDLIGRGE